MCGGVARHVAAAARARGDWGGAQDSEAGLSHSSAGINRDDCTAAWENSGQQGSGEKGGVKGASGGHSLD